MHNVRYEAKARILSSSSAIVLGAIVFSVYWPRSDRALACCPQVYLANTKVDLGGVRPSEIRDVAFLIENKGLRRLVLNEINCGCGAPVRKAILVPPGGTEEVRIGLEAGLESGTIERTVSFATNDAAHPRIDLTVVAQIDDK